MKHCILAIGMVVAMPALAADKGLPPESIILIQPDCPLEITSYDAVYQEGGTYTSKGIRHRLDYMNSTDAEIVAVRFGLVSFDVWNEFLSRMGGVGMDRLSPGATEKGTWIASTYGGFSFLTGVAYVSKVRFASGEIWGGDLDDIADELRKIEADFDASNLKEKRPQN